LTNNGRFDILTAMILPRIYDNMNLFLKPNKVLVIYGSRQTGKTTLLKKFLSENEGNLKYKLDSGDDINTQIVLGSSDFKKIIDYTRGYDLIAIDEAQRIKNIGMGLKIMVDQVPNLKIIVTGSSSFELAGQIGEPLTGRKTTVTLFALSQIEMGNLYNDYDLRSRLDDYFIGIDKSVIMDTAFDSGPACCSGCETISGETVIVLGDMPLDWTAFCVVGTTVGEGSSN
jgi:uncharacterized protein